MPEPIINEAQQEVLERMFKSYCIVVFDGATYHLKSHSVDDPRPEQVHELINKWIHSPERAKDQCG